MKPWEKRLDVAETSLYRGFDTDARLRRLVTAYAQQDMPTVDKLYKHAPRHTYQVADARFAYEAFTLLSMSHMLEIYHNALLLWRALGILNGFPYTEETEREQRLWYAVHGLAATIVRDADAWALFCQRLSIDSPGDMVAHPFWPDVRDAIDLARGLQGDLADTRVQVILSTVEDTAAEYRLVYEGLQ